MDLRSIIQGVFAVKDKMPSRVAVCCFSVWRALLLCLCLFCQTCLTLPQCQSCTMRRNRQTTVHGHGLRVVSACVQRERDGAG